MMNQKVLRVQAYLTMGKDYKRWRLWRCVEGWLDDRNVEAQEEIKRLEAKGFKAKIWMPLPQHKTSGHTHIVVLATFHEFCKLAGIGVFV